ncbi:MAG TPA: hypothetical protein VGR12_04520 [Solirubrobacteraceae bacterium]|nr:hypothetical protein [Solirubrobacteraceae bacterium]
MALHVAGLVVDAMFHDSQGRPFGAFEMLWAHGLSYLGAVAAVAGGWRAATRTSAASTACRWTGAFVGALGLVQALALTLDFVTELADDRNRLGPVIYALALLPMVVAACAGTWLCRRDGRRPPSLPERPALPR